MTTFTNISNALVAVGAKPFATTVQALRDNPVAMFEGDATAPKLQDAALGSTVTADGTNWVAARTAGVGTGAVGSYALLRFNTLTIATEGSTHAGSGLRYSSAAGDINTAPAGTWRLMGRTTTAGNPSSTSLFLRIS